MHYKRITHVRLPLHSTGTHIWSSRSTTWGACGLIFTCLSMAAGMEYATPNLLCVHKYEFFCFLVPLILEFFLTYRAHSTGRGCFRNHYILFLRILLWPPGGWELGIFRATGRERRAVFAIVARFYPFLTIGWSVCFIDINETLCCVDYYLFTQIPTSVLSTLHGLSHSLMYTEVPV